MAIFTLFATMTSAYAWFASIRNEDANQEEFYVTKLDSPLNALSIHEFYGKTEGEQTSCFTFNPVGVNVFSDGQMNNGAATVELHEYSVENPNHPVLLLFNVEAPGDAADFQSTIDLVTDYAYLGDDDNFITTKTYTKAELNTLSKANDNYYQVVTDESNNNKTTLYQYVNGSLVSMTYNSLAALDVEGNKVSANNNKYFRVVDDEEHGNVSTIYQYKQATRTFEMVWIDIGDMEQDETNPLSSAVQFFYFTFEDSIEDMTSSHTVARESFNDLTNEYSYTTQTLDCLTIPVASCNESNVSSFTSFTDEDTYEFNKELNVFSGNVVGSKYIGIVVDYNQLALEYVFFNNLGNDALNAGLKFKCDWKTEF